MTRKLFLFIWCLPALEVLAEAPDSLEWSSGPKRPWFLKISFLGTLDVLSRAEQQTATADGFREVRAAVLVTLISLPQHCRGGEAGDSNQLAPARLPAFLAVDVTRGPVLGGLHHEKSSREGLGVNPTRLLRSTAHHR